jgi:hypothetical protein
MNKFDFFDAVNADEKAAAEAKSGKKHDHRKPRMHLLFNDMSDALLEIGKVATYGANKYTDRGWRDVENNYERYSSAGYRHQLEDSYEGGELDEESGFLHAAHAAWNAIAKLQIILDRKKENGNGK